MNNKGQTLGALIMVAIALIVGLTMLTGGITQGYSELMDTAYNSNDTESAFSNTTATTLSGKEIVHITVYNASNYASLYPATNYTVTNNVILSDGTIGATILCRGTSSPCGQPVKMNYTYYPITAVTDSGSRGVISIVLIFICLAIAVIALTPVLREGIVGMIGV